MSKGKWLSPQELSDARVLRHAGANWRDIGDMLGRDYSGIRRALGGMEPLHPKPKQRSRKRRSRLDRLPKHAPIAQSVFD